MADLARPMLRRLELGNALRRLRESRAMTIAEVTEAMLERFGSSFSNTKLSRMETARRSAIPRDVHDLCVLYGVDDTERERLVELAKSARELDALGQGLDPRGYGAYIALEQQATEMRAYAMMFLPALLQTEGYARAVENLQPESGDTSAGSYRYVDPDIQKSEHERVSLRMTRQKLLEGAHPLRLHAVIDEQALHRTLGEPGIMAEQLRHLLRSSVVPNIRIQVLPLEAGLYAAAQSAHWTLLAIPADGDRERFVGYEESVLGGRLLEHESEVAKLAAVFDFLAVRALGTTGSRQRLKTILDTIDH